MKRARAICYFGLALIPLFSSQVFAVEVAPRISDREIIKKLARLEEGQNTIRAEVNGVKAEMKAGQNALQQQINDLKESTNKRFDILQWMFGIFITISLVILGFVLRMQWQMHGRQTQMETALETQKDELSFLKSLIEKLLPPKGVL